MDLQPNKVDGIVKPITNTRISASEWNQLVGSCMEFITQAGMTPDANDNEQFLNAFKAIAANLELIGANTNLSNLTATGENHFVQLQSGVAQADVDYVVETYKNGTSWYRVYKSGWCEQGGLASAGVQVQFAKEFADTNYSISGIPDGGSTANSATTIACYYKTTTSIYFTTANNTTNVIWEAKGYIS